MADVSFKSGVDGDRSGAWRAGDGVGFTLLVGNETFECRVTSEVLAGFEFAANDDFDWIGTYLRHSDRITTWPAG